MLNYRKSSKKSQIVVKKRGNLTISSLLRIYVFKPYYSSLDESFKTFSGPNLRETRIPTKSDKAINPKEAHSGTSI